MNTILRHKITLAEKQRTKYAERAADYYINRASFHSNFRREMDLLYDAAQGIININHYKKLTNPRNTKNENLIRWPAELRNYNIITPLVNLFLGEYFSSNNEPVVTAVNENEKNTFLFNKKQTILKHLSQMFVNELNSAGFETGVDTKAVPDPEKIAAEYSNNYTDMRASVGAEAVEYLKHNLRINNQLQLALYDWLVVGAVTTLKSINNNDVSYTILDPRDVVAIGIDSDQLGEDAEAIVARIEMTLPEMIDEFELGDEEINLIASDGSFSTSLINPLAANLDNASDGLDGIHVKDKYTVMFVSWRGYRRYGILTYTNPYTGLQEQTEVDETYKLQPELGDIEIEWGWDETIYTNYKLTDKLYKNFGVLVPQRKGMNGSPPKHPINCRTFGYRSNNIQSIVKTGLSSQILVNIIHFRMEFMLAKHHDKITTFPIGLIPNKAGWDEEKFLYFASVSGFAFYDETAPNAAMALQGIKQVDLSLGNYIQEMQRLASDVRQDFWDRVGMNRQRYGDNMASDGKGVTEQATFRSALITADMFRQFNELVESDWNGLLDYSKVAWADGKRGYYTKSDGAKAFFDIEGTDYLETDYNVFVKLGSEESDKINFAKSLTRDMIQNGLGHNAVLEMLDTTSLSKMKEVVNRAVEAERAFQIQQQQAEQNAEAERQRAKDDKEMLLSQDRRYIAEVNYKAVTDAARIRTGMSVNDFIGDTLEKMQELADTMGDENLATAQAAKAAAFEDAENKRLGVDNRKIEAGLIKSANDLAVARENKNRYDK